MTFSFAQAQPPTEKHPRFAMKGYAGNTPAGEKDEALKLKGRINPDHQAYQAYCESCHLPTGASNPDGRIPQLAGQQTTVLIAELADIRSGRRYNPTMYPFARELPDAQALADVAAYIGPLCIPLDSGKYSGPDAAKQIAEGKHLYEKECIRCHQPNGEGLKEMGYPVLTGQHNDYLLRQMREVRDGKRVNVPTEMFSVITKYNDEQLIAISAYQASLPTPKSMLMPDGSMCRTAAAAHVTTK